MTEKSGSVTEISGISEILDSVTDSVTEISALEIPQVIFIKGMPLQTCC